MMSSKLTFTICSFFCCNILLLLIIYKKLDNVAHDLKNIMIWKLKKWQTITTTSTIKKMMCHINNKPNNCEDLKQWFYIGCHTSKMPMTYTTTFLKILLIDIRRSFWYVSVCVWIILQEKQEEEENKNPSSTIIIIIL